MGSKGSKQTAVQQTSNTTSADPQAMGVYRDILARAQQASSTPYQTYQGPQVAGFSGDQTQAFEAVRDAQGIYQPYFDQAETFAQRAGGALTPEQIRNYYNPYQQDVVDAMTAQLDINDARGQQRLTSDAIRQGAFGGDRERVASAVLKGEQDRNRNTVIADLMSKGYSQALAAAMADRSAAGQGSQLLSGLGAQSQNLALQQAMAQLQTGSLQQQQEQQQLNVPLQDFLQQQAYPYQQLSWLAGLAGPIGGALGGTSSGVGSTVQQGPKANPWSQALGLGATALGAYLSDERAKENIEKVGELNDGQPVYRYNYKGDPRVQIGLLAQEVEESAPEAVGDVGGMKVVNYEKATDGSVEKASGGSVRDMVGQALELAGQMRGQLRSNFAQGGAPGATVGMAKARGRNIIDLFPDNSIQARNLVPTSSGSAPSIAQSGQGSDSSGQALGMLAKSIGSKLGSSSWSPMSATESISTPTSTGVGVPTGLLYADGGFVPDPRFALSAMPMQIEYQPAPTFFSQQEGGGSGLGGGGISSEAGANASSGDATGGLYADGGLVEEEPTYDDLPDSSGLSPDYMRAIAKIESGGNYRALGPVTKTGDRAYGKPQVMGANIPSWSQEALGRRLTPMQFLEDPDAQERVFKHKFGQYVAKYGPIGAAKAWFAGERGMKNPNAKDQLGTTVTSYADQFARNAGLAPEAGNEGDDDEDEAPATGLAGAPQSLSPATNVAGEPVSSQGEAPSRTGGPFGFQAYPDAGQALMAAGLRMMAARPGTSLGEAIGQGGLAGLATYQGIQDTRAKRETEAAKDRRLAEERDRAFGLQKQASARADEQLKLNKRTVDRADSKTTAEDASRKAILAQIEADADLTPIQKEIFKASPETYIKHRTETPVLREVVGSNGEKTTVKVLHGKMFTLDDKPFDPNGPVASPSVAQQDREQRAFEAGVPVLKYDRISSLPPKEQGKERSKVYATGTKVLDKEEEAVKGYADDINQANRFMDLNRAASRLTSGVGTGVLPAVTADAAEMDKISIALARKMRQPGEGATSDFDAKSFQKATMSRDKPLLTNENVAAGIIAQKQNQIDYHAFRRDYLEQNGTLDGSFNAWKSYLEANPIFDPKVFGKNADIDPEKLRMNPNRMGYKEWFREQMRPAGTGAPPTGDALKPGTRWRFERDGKKYLGVWNGTSWEPERN